MMISKACDFTKKNNGLKFLQVQELVSTLHIRLFLRTKNKPRGWPNLTYVVLEDFNSVESLKAIILGNIPVNTGYSDRLCACLKRKLGRNLCIVICFLHVNKLPLRHVISNLDGQSVSPIKFSGPIGQ
jgi:hypothetical protein